MTPLALFDRNDRPTAEACRRDALAALPPRQVNDGHRRVLEALADGPLTDEEIVAATGLSPNAERPRRGELVESGRVVDTGQTRATKSGRKATLWGLR